MQSLNLMKHASLNLKRIKLIAPIMVTPNWSENFEIMCDASDYAMGAVLRQRTEKIFRGIYYASKKFNKAQENYSTIEKEMLAMVFACDKFRPYILGSHVLVHIDHVAIKYPMAKKYAKPRLIIWKSIHSPYCELCIQMG